MGSLLWWPGDADSANYKKRKRNYLTIFASQSPKRHNINTTYKNKCTFKAKNRQLTNRIIREVNTKTINNNNNKTIGKTRVLVHVVVNKARKRTASGCCIKRTNKKRPDLKLTNAKSRKPLALTRLDTRTKTR